MSEHSHKVKRRHILENEMRLGGSVGWASGFGSGHDLAVCEFQLRVGVCADGSEPGASFRLCVPFSFCPHPLTVCSSLFQK